MRRGKSHHRRLLVPSGDAADTADRAARLGPDTLVMHPGPVNRGIEIAGEVVDSARSLVTEQVANGVAVRMAVLWSLLGGGEFV